MSDKKEVKIVMEVNGEESDVVTSITSKAVTEALSYTPMDASLKGVKSGIAELDENGIVLSSQLPSYVDDTIEGYFNEEIFYNDNEFTTEILPESGKIYVDLITNKTYRWSGTTYVVISETLALGETSSTAYRGDRGKIAYDHSQSDHAPSNAEKNQNAYANISVGDILLKAVTVSDTLNFKSGDNITIVPNELTNTLELIAHDTTYNLTTDTEAGLFSPDYKKKLDAIDEEANKYVLPAAGESLGGVKSGGDVTITDGVISVNDDSHNHVISNIDGLQTALDGKSSTGHQHYYAGSSSLGGVATSAAKLSNTSAIGSATRPVYFNASGVPVAGTYSLNKTVPSDAVFTDTTYSNFVKSGSGAKAGLVPAPSTTAGTTKYLREDGTWTVPPDTNTDTKNTAGSTDSASKLFLIGATSQAANPQTYSHNTAYVGTDGCLYSNSKKVSTEGHTHSYLPLSGGTLTGKTTISKGLAFASGSAASNDSMPYFLGIEAFADGGDVKYITASKVCSAIGAAASSHGTHVTFTTTTPKANGTAAVGTATTVSRSDHVHPSQTTVSGNAGSATKLATARTIDGVSFNGSAAIHHYGTCSTAAETAAKVVTLSGFSLVTGAKITVIFSNGNTADAVTLNVNNTGAKALYYNGSAMTYRKVKLPANAPIDFIYDGTNWIYVGNITTVTQNNNTTNSNYRLLLSFSADDEIDRASSYKSSKFTANPSTGVLSATTFSGSGASLTNLNASKLSSGTVPIARIPTGTTSTTVSVGNHTHKYAGSSSAGGAATSAAKLTNTTAIGSATQPVYFNASGVPVAGTYSLNKTVPSDAVFTDTNTMVTQTYTTTNTSYPILLRTSPRTTETTSSTTTSRWCNKFYANPSIGVFNATSFKSIGTNLINSGIVSFPQTEETFAPSETSVTITSISFYSSLLLNLWNSYGGVASTIIPVNYLLSSTSNYVYVPIHFINDEFDPDYVCDPLYVSYHMKVKATNSGLTLHSPVGPGGYCWNGGYGFDYKIFKI